jgi:hypothetical protein
MEVSKRVYPLLGLPTSDVQMTVTALSTEVRVWAESLWLYKADPLRGVDHDSHLWDIAHSLGPGASCPASAYSSIPCPIDPLSDHCPWPHPDAVEDS